MSFERVEKRGGRTADVDPLFTIYPRLEGRFNKTATVQYLADVDRVEFFVDTDGTRLGIARGGSGDDSYTLIRDGSGRAASLRSALREFGLQQGDVEESVALPIEHDPDEGLLVVDLDPLFEEVPDGGE